MVGIRGYRKARREARAKCVQNPQVRAYRPSGTEIFCRGYHQTLACLANIRRRFATGIPIADRWPIVKVADGGRSIPLALDIAAGLNGGGIGVEHGRPRK